MKTMKQDKQLDNLVGDLENRVIKVKQIRNKRIRLELDARSEFLTYLHFVFPLTGVGLKVHLVIVLLTASDRSTEKRP